MSATTQAPTCSTCGEEFRLVWIGNDPPEPYGEVCGCPEAAIELHWARQEKAAMDREHSPIPKDKDNDA